ncbi:MAG: hypothetical protein M0000_04080 [Actinomycetota bacterium]|nr:hypothetical protein [Actinomycetota bacterium]
MRELGSKKDVADKEKHAEDETEHRLEGAKDHKKEVEATRDAWDGMEDPALSETAEQLRKIADVIERHVAGEAERHHGEVMEGVGEEQRDVSTPTNEASADEENAAHELEGRGAAAGRYLTEMEQTARARSEAAEFLREIADLSEDHQEKSQEGSEELSEEAKAAAEGLKKF